MASHYVAIAKASLAAGLLRQDPTSINRDEIQNFHALLDEVILKCSPSNIQKCKAWLLKNVIPSVGRITSFGKYLAALSTSLGKAASTEQSKEEPQTAEKPSLKTKRLHILYLLNDLFHHIKYHAQPAGSEATFSTNIQSQLLAIFSSTASFDGGKESKHYRKLDDLLAIWDEHSYTSAECLNKMREALTASNGILLNAAAATVPSRNDAVAEDRPSEDKQGKRSKENQFLLPAFHGDPSTPYYDLPAGNLMRHMNPNSSIPINPKLVKVMEFESREPHESLVMAVESLLRDVDLIYGSDNTALISENVDIDIDEMGQAMTKESTSGELRATEGYYGWSINFCERMKKRRRGEGLEENGESKGWSWSRNHSRSRSRSRTRSRTPRKRRRFSSSGSDIHNRSRSRDRYRSSSRSRSASRHARRRRRYSRSVSHDRRPHKNSSRSRSPMPLGSSTERSLPRSGPSLGNDVQTTSVAAQVQHTAQSHEQSTLSSFNSTRPSLVTPIDQIDNPFSNPLPPTPMAPTAGSYPHNFPLGPGGLPVPPPPQFHQVGQWPPAMPFMHGQHAPTFAVPQHGFVPPLPPASSTRPTLQRAWSGSHGYGQGAPQEVRNDRQISGLVNGGLQPPVPPPPPPLEYNGIWQHGSASQLPAPPPPGGWPQTQATIQVPWNSMNTAGQQNWPPGQDPRKR